MRKTDLIFEAIVLGVIATFLYSVLNTRVAALIYPSIFLLVLVAAAMVQSAWELYIKYFQK